MKGIIVTNSNMKSIYGRIQKFFNNHEYFTVWHNFDCGSRKRINKEIRLISGENVNVVRYHSRPHGIELDHNFGGLIRIRFSRSSIFVIQCGDKVKFSGSKIIIKMKFIIPDIHSHIYEVFQINDERRSY